MADIPEIHDLARRYLDLWQLQLRQAANDPDIAAAVAKLSATVFLPGLAGTPPVPGDDAGADRAAAARPPPERRSRDLDEFADRLAALEKRLAALEKKSRASGRSGPAKPRKGKS